MSDGDSRALASLAVQYIEAAEAWKLAKERFPDDAVLERRLLEAAQTRYDAMKAAVSAGREDPK